jgi:hypothetical protein
MSVTSQAAVFAEGKVVGSGTFICRGCGTAVSVEATEELPACCDAGYRRASLFEQPTADAAVVECSPADPAWLESARARVSPGEVYLALEYTGHMRVEALTQGWTRIGRSGSAHIRLDDPTVSRRHAQIVLTEDGEVRVIDDRSLNGVYVNGTLVEWSPLGDGDELAIGRYRLRVLGEAGAGQQPAAA